MTASGNGPHTPGTRQRRGACHICQMLVPQRAPRAHPLHAAADRLRRSDSPVVAHVVRGVDEDLSPELGVHKIMWFNERYDATWMERVGLALELSTSSHTSAPTRSRDR